jgi:flagellar motility protein MotE (MotC chaperone)
MADKALNPKQLQGSKQTEKKSTFLKRTGWVMLVGVVPILATIVLVGVALQIIGFPVWRTTLDAIGVGTHTTVATTPLQIAKKDLATATAKERLDSSQISDLRHQIQADEQQIAALMTQVNQLSSKQNSAVSSQNQAKQEANVLTQMDPGQAANVLSKMQQSDAASVVAAMSASDSGAILGQMGPADAGKILTMAAKLKSAAAVPQQANNNTTGG